MTASFLFQSLLELNNLWQEGLGAENVKDHLTQIYPLVQNPLDAVLYLTDSYDCKSFPEIVVGTFSFPEVGSLQDVVVKTFNFWFCNNREAKKFNTILQRIYSKLQFAMSTENWPSVTPLIISLGLQRVRPNMTFMSLVPHTLNENHTMVDLCVSAESVYLERAFIQFMDSLLVIDPSKTESIWGQNAALLRFKLPDLVEFYRRRYQIQESATPNLVKMKKEKIFGAMPTVPAIISVNSYIPVMVPVPVSSVSYMVTASPMINKPSNPHLHEGYPLMSALNKRAVSVKNCAQQPFPIIQFAKKRGNYSAWRSEVAKTYVPRKKRPLQITNPRTAEVVVPGARQTISPVPVDDYQSVEVTKGLPEKHEQIMGIDNFTIDMDNLDESITDQEILITSAPITPELLEIIEFSDSISPDLQYCLNSYMQELFDTCSCDNRNPYVMTLQLIDNCPHSGTNFICVEALDHLCSWTRTNTKLLSIELQLRAFLIVTKDKAHWKLIPTVCELYRLRGISGFLRSNVKVLIKTNRSEAAQLVIDALKFY